MTMVAEVTNNPRVESDASLLSKPPARKERPAARPGLRDSIRIGLARHPTKQQQPDTTRDDLGSSTGTASTVTTEASSDSSLIFTHHETRDASTTLIPGPNVTPDKSIMKYKTHEESLQQNYCQTSKKASKKRSLRRRMKNTLSTTKTTSSRFLHIRVSNSAEPQITAAEESDPLDATENSSRNKRRKSFDEVLGELSVSECRAKEYEEELKDIVPAGISSTDEDGPTLSIDSLNSHQNLNRPAVDRRATMAKMKNSSLLSGSKAELYGSTRSLRNLFQSSKRMLGSSMESFLSHGSKSLEEDDRPKVTFEYVEIREYVPAVDDNPCVSRGPALTLGWEYALSDRVALDLYEELHPPRREMTEMIIPLREREARLLASGVSKSELQAAVKRTNIARRNRLKTIEMLKHHTMHECIEGAKRKFKKVVGLQKSREAEEENLWENAQYYFAASG